MLFFSFSPTPFQLQPPHFSPPPPSHSHFSSLSTDHYKHHWFPQIPCKGSGYRCLRINHKMDPLIGRAAGHIGLSHHRLFHLLPSELTMWVDPFEVSYRIGEDGSICVLYDGSPAVGKPLDTHSSCKNAFRMGRHSPSKNYGMMTVSS